MQRLYIQIVFRSDAPDRTAIEEQPTAASSAGSLWTVELPKELRVAKIGPQFRHLPFTNTSQHVGRPTSSTTLLLGASDTAICDVLNTSRPRDCSVHVQRIMPVLFCFALWVLKPLGCFPGISSQAEIMGRILRSTIRRDSPLSSSQEGVIARAPYSALLRTKARSKSFSTMPSSHTLRGTTPSY